jgi:hypothetical protein
MNETTTTTVSKLDINVSKCSSTFLTGESTFRMVPCGHRLMPTNDTLRWTCRHHQGASNYGIQSGRMRSNHDHEDMARHYTDHDMPNTSIHLQERDTISPELKYCRPQRRQAVIWFVPHITACERTRQSILTLDNCEDFQKGTRWKT